MNRNNNDVFTYFSQLKSSSTSKLGQQEAGSSLTGDDQQSFASNSESTQSTNEQEQEAESVTSVDQPNSNNGGSPKQQLLNSASNDLLNQHQLDTKLFNCVWPSKPINILELQSLRSSILTSLAYVALCLKDYTSTIKYSNMLLDTNDQLNSKYPISRGHRYLASSYLAEANLYLDKLNESIECLNQAVKLDSENDISFVPPKLIEQIQSTSNELKSLNILFLFVFFYCLNEHFLFECALNRKELNDARLVAQKWFPKDANTAKAIGYFNMTVIYAVRNEIDTALKTFNMVSEHFLNVNMFQSAY